MLSWTCGLLMPCRQYRCFMTSSFLAGRGKEGHGQTEQCSADEDERRKIRARRRHLRDQMRDFQPGRMDTYPSHRPSFSGYEKGGDGTTSSGGKTWKDMSSDTFFNVHFETIGNQKPSPRSRREKKLRQDEKIEKGSEDAYQPRHKERGTMWFRQRWGYQASLDLEDLDFETDERRSKPEGRRRRKQRTESRRGHDDSVDGDFWENEHGYQWTSGRGGAERPRQYSRVGRQSDEDTNKDWFQAWQGGASARGAATSAWWDRFRSAAATSQQSTGGQGERQADNLGGGSARASSIGGEASWLKSGLDAHLKVLGLSSGTALTRTRLKATFHHIAKAWHPDLHKEQVAKSIAEEKFRSALEAYTVLLKHVH